MPVATTTILAATAVAGLGLSAFGMQQQAAGRETQAAGARLQSQGSQVQAIAAQQAAEGAQTQVRGAAAQNAATKEITGLEQQTEAQRFAAMELDARRQSLEAIRQGQRARALGLTSATQQGAGYGSGLQGGYGQISGQTNQNLLGIGQNLEIGRNIFGINSQITQQRLAYAAGGDIINEGQGAIARSQGLSAIGSGIIAQGGGVVAQGAGQVGFGQGLSSLGGAFVQAAPTVANLGTFGQSFFNSGSNVGFTPAVQNQRLFGSSIY
jgi:hypothetical protein